jgi:CO/xanthine dehydrogenase FAD-binding subunit
MDLHTITCIKRPLSADEITQWPDGHAWLAGGTWLFSEPQLETDTLVDLDRLGWPALEATPTGLEIAATCRIAELERHAATAAWPAAPLVRACCRSLLASFKVCNAATVGGNICMSLPAGAMISLAVALEATCTLWPRAAPARQVATLDFVTGNHANVLRQGELLRSIHIPAAALAKRFAWRRSSLTRLGRSAALIIGTRSPTGADLLLTITAATPRPVQLGFAAAPSAADLHAAIDGAIPTDGWFGDIHGSAAYKRHLTYHFAEQIRAELARPGAEA